MFICYRVSANKVLYVFCYILLLYSTAIYLDAHVTIMNQEEESVYVISIVC